MNISVNERVNGKRTSCYKQKRSENTCEFQCEWVPEKAVNEKEVWMKTRCNQLQVSSLRHYVTVARSVVRE